MNRRMFVGVVAAVLTGTLLLGAGPNQEVLASSATMLAAAKTECEGFCIVCAGSGNGHNAMAFGPECLPPNVQCQGDAMPGDGWHEQCDGSNNCTGHPCSDGSPSPEELTLPSESLFR